MNRTLGFGLSAFFAVLLLAMTVAPEEAQAGRRGHGCCGARQRHHRHHRVHRGGCHGAYQGCQPAVASCCGTAAVDYGCSGNTVVDGESSDGMAPPPPAPEAPPEAPPADAGASPSDNPPPPPGA